MITTISLVNIYHYGYKIFFPLFSFFNSFLFFLMMRTFKIHRTLWKTIISQRFSHRSESLGPHTSGSPVWGSDTGKKSPQSIWLWRPAGLDHKNSTGLGKTDSTLRGCTQALINTRTWGEKNSDYIAAWTRPTCWSWRVSWGSRRQPRLTVWARTPVAEVLGSIHWCELS